MPRALRNPLSEYYGCTEESVRITSPGQLPAEAGFFRFGDTALGYGRCSSGTLGYINGSPLPDALGHAYVEAGCAHLPFDLSEIVANLRLERYAQDGALSRPGFIHPALRTLYYLARPYLSDPARGRLKRLSLHGWQDIRFPKWPVDRTVEELLGEILLLLLKNNSGAPIPFIWFWPDAATGCVVMTHDVETAAGRNACSQLMDIDESCGIKASFQIVPQGGYEVTLPFVHGILARGFEVNVQDLNHDGRLFQDHEEFQRRAKRINRYAQPLRRLRISLSSDVQESGLARSPRCLIRHVGSQCRSLGSAARRLLYCDAVLRWRHSRITSYHYARLHAFRNPPRLLA